MGISILELMVRLLRDNGFSADAGYPGQKYPVITEPSVAVHIQKVDRANLEITMEFSVICPAEMGGAQCELEALRVTELLRSYGAVCIQNGCSYDGLAQVYVVPVTGTFSGIAGAENYTVGTGFDLCVDYIQLNHVVSFQAELSREHQVQHVMGENAPVAITQGSWAWQLRLEELIPIGDVAAEQCSDPFQLDVTCDGIREVYTQCRWTGESREYTRSGLRRIRTGIAMSRKEENIGEAEI